MKKLTTIALSMLAASALPAAAHTVLLSESFEGDWQKNFSYLELDHQMPRPDVSPLFQDENGVSRPWWRLKDSNASDDAFIGSHSSYSPAGKSNDWLVSGPLYIPTTRFNLTFGAQSYVMRSGDRLSDLRVFITETAPAEGNLPTEPALFVEKVGEGKYQDAIEKDFIPYEINLDKYAGKTIYISFANLNEDKDILCLDNILVQRLDIAALTCAAPRYVEKGEFEISYTVEASTDAEVKNWKLMLDKGDGSEPVEVKSGAVLKPGEPATGTVKVTADADQTVSWTLRLSADDLDPLSKSGVTSGLAFLPFHRVLLEEATGIWCGNCPLGIYAIENMTTHPEMKDYVIPVSLHITQGTPASDYLCENDYITMSGLTNAPSMRIDRSRQVTMFSIANDGAPIDLDNTLSVAHKVKKTHEQVTLFDIDVKGDFVTAGADTTAVKAKVTLRPALTLPGSPYKVGFILVENNVGVDNSPFYRQENYFSGQDLTSRLGGFCDLPKKAENWKYQDVARAIYDFHGHQDIKLPETVKMGENYEFEVTLPIPDTYKELTSSSGAVTVAAPKIVAGNLVLVAFMLDEADGFSSVNSAMYPMTEQAEQKLSIADLAKASGAVEGISGDDALLPAEYYTLEGIRVLSPGKGLHIEKRGSKTRKVML